MFISKTKKSNIDACFAHMCENVRRTYTIKSHQRTWTADDIAHGDTDAVMEEDFVTGESYATEVHEAETYKDTDFDFVSLAEKIKKSIVDSIDSVSVNWSNTGLNVGVCVDSSEIGVERNYTVDFDIANLPAGSRQEFCQVMCALIEGKATIE
jgi:hypothetical protein